MSALIVDFPPDREPRAKAKALRFAPMSELQLYYQSPDEFKTFKSDLFYSDGELREMKIANTKTVQKLHRLYQALSSMGLGIEEISKHLDGLVIIGLENYLTLDLTRRLLRRRKERTSAVLLEQVRQGVSGEADPDEIARVSRNCSRWARKRAVTIASFVAPDRV